MKLLKKIGYAAAIMALCFCVGILFGRAVENLRESLEFSSKLGPLILELAALMAVYFLCTIIHECGHLVMGRLTGYRMVSFRIGSLTFVKENGSLKLRRFSVPGTGGQCVMTHDPVEDVNDIPYFWFHFGGCFLNFLTAAVSAAVFAVTDRPLLSLAALNFLVLSLFIGVMNSVPLDLGVPNDGMNIRTQRIDPNARLAMLNILIINGRQYDGESLAAMPDELFCSADPEGNSPYCDMAELYAVKLISSREFAQAESILSALVSSGKLPPVLENEARCELFFCKIVLDRPHKEIDRLYDRSLKSYISQTERYMASRRRLMYAYYLIYKNNENEDKTTREYHALLDMREKYPCRSEYEDELALTNQLKERYTP